MEYRLPRVAQVQVNPKIGLSFASVLRAALRQDPDIVLVGEMRDQETASIGLRAAMTGHMVMSTLHTNDAVGTAIRLLDMGAEPYLTATALRAVLAQRLVRRICEYCSEPYPPNEREAAWVRSIDRSLEDVSAVPFKKGRGCHNCNNTGYRGRIGVYELLELTEDLADHLRRMDAAGFTRAALADPNFKTLSRCALEYAQQGVTSLEEVFRISAELHDQSADEEVV